MYPNSVCEFIWSWHLVADGWGYPSKTGNAEVYFDSLWAPSAQQAEKEVPTKNHEDHEGQKDYKDHQDTKIAYKSGLSCFFSSISFNFVLTKV